VQEKLLVRDDDELGVGRNLLDPNSKEGARNKILYGRAYVSGGPFGHILPSRVSGPLGDVVMGLCLVTTSPQLQWSTSSGGQPVTSYER
jgi:hypothetical protein